MRLDGQSKGTATNVSFSKSPIQTNLRIFLKVNWVQHNFGYLEILTDWSPVNLALL